MEKFFTPEELAGRFKLTRMTIYRLIRARKIPAIRIGKSYRISEQDLEKWMEGQRVSNQAEGRKLPTDRK